MEDWRDRTIKLIGKEQVYILNNSNVIVFGVGGVGGFAIEGLVRAGIGNFTIVDNDVVSLTNINRQIIATCSTIGKDKTEVMKLRILDINPNAKVNAIKEFVTPYNIDKFNLKQFDFIVDAIDNITAKIALAKYAEDNGINIISCMGTGNKVCPEMFEISDIYKTSVCPLAKVMRKELKARGVKHLKVLYSKEQPCSKNASRTPASISFTVGIAGLRLAEYVIKCILNI